MSLDRTKGWYRKYHIEKTDGSPMDPHAIYFVLRLDEDPAARLAMHVYAKAVEKSSPQLAFDIRFRLLAIECQLLQTPNIRLFRDGNQWCALVGEDLQNGSAGFGECQHEALESLLEALLLGGKIQ